MNQDINLKATAYGYLQSNFYQNPELYHESVAHFSTAMGKALFIPKSLPPTRFHNHITCTSSSENSLDCHAQNLSKQHDGDHIDDDYPCGHAHEDETTSIESLYPQFNTKSAHFSFNYEDTYANLSIPSPQPKIISKIDEENDIIYIGQDSNIFHIKFLITGDQNAGKSTFLHALTNSHDHSYLLLNRYLPILQASFYNARIIKHDDQNDQNDQNSPCHTQLPPAPIPSSANTSPTEIFRDEFPFIDTDIGVTQLFLTADDLWLFLEEINESSTSPAPQYISKSKLSSYTDMISENDIILPEKYTTPHHRPHQLTFLPPDHSNSTSSHHNDIDVVHSQMDNSSHKSLLPSPYNKLLNRVQNYPHVCLEFVEVGGDHLDRIAKYLLDQYHTEKCIDQQSDRKEIKIEQEGKRSEKKQADNTVSLLSGVCELYHIIANTATFQQQHSCLPTMTDLAFSTLFHSCLPSSQQRPQDAPDESIQTLLRRTISLMQPYSQESTLASSLSQTNDKQTTPLSYFLNINTLIDFTTPLPINIVLPDTKDNALHVKVDNKFFSLPIYSINTCQYMTIMLRMCLLILIQFQSQEQQTQAIDSIHDESFENLNSNNNIPIFSLQTLLLRAPTHTYNLFQQDITSPQQPQFKSPFNSALRSNVGNLNNQPHAPLSPSSFLAMTSSLATPQSLFSGGELELPIEPLIHICPYHFLSSLLSQLASLYPDLTATIYHSICSEKPCPIHHEFPINKINPPGLIISFITSLFVTMHELYQGYPSFQLDQHTTTTSSAPQFPYIVEFATFFDAFITTHINNFFEHYSSTIDSPGALPFFPYIDVSSNFVTHTFIKGKSNTHCTPTTTTTTATYTRIIDISTDPGAVLASIASMLHQYCLGLDE